MNKKIAVLICFIGLLFGACSKKDSAVKASGDSSADGKALGSNTAGGKTASNDTVDNKTVGDPQANSSTNSTKKDSSIITLISNSILFQNICSSARNNFQPCVDMQDKNEEKLVKKVNNCFGNGLDAFKKVDDALTAKQREALGLEYRNALLGLLGCYLGAYRSGAEENKLCMSQFIGKINSNFCPKD